MRSIIHVIVPALSLLTIGVEAATIAKGVTTKHSSDDLQVRKLVHERQFHNADYGLESQHFARKEYHDTMQQEDRRGTTLEVGPNKQFTGDTKQEVDDDTNKAGGVISGKASTLNADDSANNKTGSSISDDFRSAVQNEDSSNSQPGNVTLTQIDSTGNQTSSEILQAPGVGSSQDSSSSPGQEALNGVTNSTKIIQFNGTDATGTNYTGPSITITPSNATATDSSGDALKTSSPVISPTDSTRQGIIVTGPDSTAANSTGDSSSDQVSSNITLPDGVTNTNGTSKNAIVSKFVNNISPVATGNGSEPEATGSLPSSVPFVGSLLSYVFNLFTGLSGSIPSGQADSSGVGLTGYHDDNEYTKRQDMEYEDADQLEGSDSQNDLSPILEKASGPFSDAMVVPQSFERRMAKVPRTEGVNVTVDNEQLPGTSDLSVVKSLKSNEGKSSIADLD